MSLPVYDTFKPSGVEWLGQVPSHWRLAKLRYLANFVGGGTPDRDKPEFWGGDLPWVSPKDMKTEQILGAQESITEEGLAGSSSSLIEPGAVLMVVRSGILQHTIPVAQNAVPVALNQDMKALRFNEECSSAFFVRWVQGLNNRLRLAWAKQGATVESVEHAYLADTIIPLPPPAEQTAIVAFLDRETGKIDALVEAQRRLIKLLMEKRQAVISHAVTKGLDPAAPMKDSGVEWLGEVPARWTIAPLKRFTTLLSGFAFPSAGFSQDAGHTPLLRGINVGVGRTRWADVVYWERSKDDGLDDYELRKGDLVLGMDRPWIGDGLRIAMISEADLPCLLLQRVAAIRPNARVCAEYVPLLLEGEAFHHHCVPEMTGVSVPHISPGQVGDFVVTLPPLPEQRAITAHVRTVAQAADSLIGAAHRAIVLLQERRSALISAAVTGKIDVRHSGSESATADQATARRLVGAAVLELVADNPASGRMTSAKRMYLVEAHAGVRELRGQPERKAAGPFDGALMRDVEGELARVGHITTRQPGGPHTQVFYSLTGTRGHFRAELDAMLGDRRSVFDKLLRDLGTLEARGVEGVATLYAVWNDMLIDDQTPTDDAVIDGVLNDWDPEKKDKFTRPDLRVYLEWMRRHDLTPHGQGPRTKMGALL